MVRSSVQGLSSAVAWTCRQCRQRNVPNQLPFRPAPLKWTPPSIQRSSFSSTARQATEPEAEAPIEIKAAPEINFDDGKPEDGTSKFSRPARIIPTSPSYFTGSPILNDNTLLLESLVEKYSHIPTVSPDRAPRAYWKRLGQYRAHVGERVPASKYAKIVRLLNQLNKIHPDFLPTEVIETIEQFRRPGSDRITQAKPGKIDQWGRSLGVGRRKEATARVWLVEGDGQVLVNGRSIAQAFPRLHDRESALWALSSTARIDKYNVFALISGGGLTGQAESMTLAVAKALLVHEPSLKPALRRAGCVTSDARRVERKKPGRLKARKMPTWVKR